MKNLFFEFLKDDSGATAIEYGIIAGGIFVAIVTIIGEIGTEVQQPFNDAKTGMQ